MFGIRLQSLRTRLFLGVFFASVIPYLLGGAYIGRVVIERIEKNYIQQAHEAMNSVDDELEHSFLRPVENLVTLLAYDDRLLNLADLPLNNYTQFDSSAPFSDRDDPALKRNFANLKRNYGNIDTIFLASSQGGYLETPPFRAIYAYDPRERTWYQNTLEHPGQIVMSEPYVTTVTRKLVISATHTVDYDGRTLGVVGVMIPLKELQEKVTAAGIGETGYLMILNPAGKIIVSPKHPEWLLKTPDEVGLEAVLQTNSTDTLTPFLVDGIEQFVVSHAADKRGWRIVAIIDRAELTAQAAPLRNLIASVYIATLLLVLLTISYATKRITQPLQEMTVLTTQMAGGNLETTDIQVTTNDELGQLAQSFSSMARNLKRSYGELELRVEERTQDLNAANEELQAMNLELHETINRLNETQALLVKTEKLAALGSLVAGVAHEINTPAGVALTAASHLATITGELAARYAANNVKRSELSEYIHEAQQATQILLTNLDQAIRLVRNFKQVSADPSREQRQPFNVRERLDSTLSCYINRLQDMNLSVRIDCDSNLEINSYPEAFSDVFANLLTNSLLHAYQPDDNGRIVIQVEQQPSNQLLLRYSDDGRGIDESIQERIFEPFFTTKRESGATGLGLPIVYNIIAQQFAGTIDCQSQVGSGTTFTITLPLEQ